MKKRTEVISVIAKCQDCGKEFGFPNTARTLALRHARLYGHVVIGTVTSGFKYNGYKKL